MRLSARAGFLAAVAMMPKAGSAFLLLLVLQVDSTKGQNGEPKVIRPHQERNYYVYAVKALITLLGALAWPSRSALVDLEVGHFSYPKRVSIMG